METCLMIISGLLLLIVAVLFIRIIQYKRQMHIFAEKIEHRMTNDVYQSIHVEYFDKDIIELANSLNKYSDMIKEKNIELENDRKQLKNVIAGISHDFRTPLTSAKGYMQLMKKSGNLTEKDQEYLDIAIAKTDYLRVLSDAFFEVSAVDAKDDEIEISKVAISDILSNHVLEQYEWVRESGMEASIDIPEKSVYVNSNPTMLDRIIANFFSNLRKYAVSKFDVKLIENADEVIVSCSNDIEESNEIDVRHIFEAFYRGTSRQKEGTGLGLYVVKCLADKLGHSVEASVKDNMFEIKLVVSK